MACTQENIPATFEAVATRCSVPLDKIKAIASSWTEEDARMVAYHANELKRLGVLAEIREVGRDLMSSDQPEAATEMIAYAVTRLSGAAALQTNRSGDAHSVGEAAWESLVLSAGEAPRTGLDWFDELAGGIWPGMNYWFAGAYKSGKTTLARNVLLSLAEAGVPCDMFCAEGSREQFALDCQAMIATGILCDHGERQHGKMRLSGMFIRRAWRQQRTFTPAEYTAINEARERWNTLNVRVWDAIDGIRDLATLRHRIQQSKFEYGVRVFFLDYSQLFGGDTGTLFERQSQVAKFAQNVAADENVTTIVLTQRNEASIQGGGDGYSAGVKGGGDASAAADFLLMPQIDKDTPTLFKVRLKHSRHSAPGEGTHIINPSSGMILDKWYNRQGGRNAL